MSVPMPEIGIFVVPNASDPKTLIDQVLAADAGELAYVGIQDHPYQRRFFDTWTLLSFLAARTHHIRFVPDVLNLPLRPPAMLAKAAVSLDLLSDGRLEIGLGAGGFWDAIAAMGGPRRTAKESVDAVEEALPILRGYFEGHETLRVDGNIYTVAGTRPGPPPAHRIGVWLGAYRPRMLSLTGREADGWLPSLGAGRFLDDADVPPLQDRIDDAARRAGREPHEIRRVANLIAPLAPAERGRDRLLRVAELGFDTILVAVPEEEPVSFVRHLAEDVIPRLG